MKELIHQENDFSLEKYGDLVGTKNVGRVARIVFQICHTRLIEILFMLLTCREYPLIMQVFPTCGLVFQQTVDTVTGTNCAPLN
jgi:hypothetical protein